MRKNTDGYFCALATGVRNALGRILPADGYSPVDLKLWAVQILIDRQASFKREPVPLGRAAAYSFPARGRYAGHPAGLGPRFARAHDARVNAIDIALVVHATRAEMLVVLDTR